MRTSTATKKKKKEKELTKYFGYIVARCLGRKRRKKQGEGEEEKYCYKPLGAVELQMIWVCAWTAFRRSAPLSPSYAQRNEGK
jgi:hypothetical protein